MSVLANVANIPRENVDGGGHYTGKRGVLKFMGSQRVEHNSDRTTTTSMVRGNLCTFLSLSL